MSEQTLSFQADVSRLLDIVANSLYTNKEIFLRELISNASDACDRLRYAAITEPALSADDANYKITLSLDKKARRLSVTDNGIGMSREDLISSLGTIARSGTAAFVESLDDKKADLSQIGKFGVGFYSAFMVADKVEVTSRKAGEEEGWSWVSDGKGEFAVAQCDDAPKRGTCVALHLKKGEGEYLEPDRLRKIVRSYSDHIGFPILLEAAGEAGQDEALNAASAIWTRAKSEITEEQYREFYHHVAHVFDDPWAHLHFKVEGVLEYSGLLFIPSARPFDLFNPDRQHRVRLYVKRVLITEECQELLPSYLRFLRGIIDSEDLPLHISRELLQRNPMLTKIRNAVVKRVLGLLKKRAEKEPEEYAKFWDNFGAVLKEGIYEDERQRETLLALSRFHTTGTEGLTSLADYIARMKPGQDAIYTLAGEEGEALMRSPQLEGFKAKGIEVLLLTDPVDEFWVPAVGSYLDKPFKSVTRGDLDLDKVESEAKDPEAKDKDEERPEIDALLAFVRLTLKDQVKDVRASVRLTDSPCCLVADEAGLDMHLERLLKQHRQLEAAAPKILEINPTHPLIRRLNERIGAKGAGTEIEEVAYLLLDQARILEGEPLPDPTAFARRLSNFLEKGLEA